jgi:hypothetical protein
MPLINTEIGLEKFGERISSASGKVKHDPGRGTWFG